MKRSVIKLLWFFLLNLVLSSVAFAQSPVSLEEEHFFDSNENTALEDYFHSQGLVVSKPILRNTALLNADTRTIYEGSDYVFNVQSEGLILSFDDAVKNDLILSLQWPSGKKEIYHQMGYLTFAKVPPGVYKLRLERSLSSSVNFSVYSGNYEFPTDAALILTPSAEDFSHLNDNLKDYLSAGGVVINVGSEKINYWVEDFLGTLQKIDVEGESEGISAFGQNYFYIPATLFNSEEKAGKVIKVLAGKMAVPKRLLENTLVFAGFIIGLFLALLIWRKRKNFKKTIVFSGNHCLKKVLLNFTVLTFLGILSLVVLLYLYQNYSGLDLFPNFTIADFIEQWQLKLVGGVFFGVALLVFGFLVVSQLLAGKRALLVFGIAGVIGLFGFALYWQQIHQNDSTLQFVKTEFNAQAKDFPDGQMVVRSRYPLVKKQGDQTEILQNFVPEPEAIVKALDTKNSGTFYADVQNNVYYCYVEKPVISGTIVMRGKNKNFANKSFYLTLEDLHGNKSKTAFYAGPEFLPGEKGQLYSDEFKFENVLPGFYALRIENADPNSEGDYELVTLKVDDGKVISINEVLSTAREFTMDLSNSADVTIKALQRDKLLDFGFLVK